MTDYANKNKVKRTTLLGQQKPKIGSVLLVLLFAAPIVVMVLVAILTSSKGAELVAIETQVEDVRNTNRELKDKIVAEASLTKLGESAQDMGMADPAHVVYVERQSSARASIN